MTTVIPNDASNDHNGENFVLISGQPASPGQFPWLASVWNGGGLTKGSNFLIFTNICKEGPENLPWSFLNKAKAFSGGPFLCTASIISSMHAITASSCTIGSKSDSTDGNEGFLSIVAGEHNLFETDTGQMRWIY